MSEKRIVVPEGMLKAAYNAQLPADNPTFEWEEASESTRKGYIRIFEAALLWLYDDLNKLEHKPYEDAAAMEYNSCLADVRRMFLAPELEIPEQIKDLLVAHFNSSGVLHGAEHKASDARYAHNAAVVEAFRRGQKVGAK